MKRRGDAKLFADAAKLNERTHSLLLIDLRKSAKINSIAGVVPLLQRLQLLVCHSEMENGKQVVRIGPNAREAEASRNGQTGEAFLRVLIRELRDDFFTA